MFKLKTRGTFIDKVKGFVMKPIQYEVRVPNGNWSPYFGDYNNQKWGAWDSNSCWCLSAVNCLEDQLEYLVKTNQFTKEALDFFIKYKYIDADGDFSISERYLEILGGYKDNGGYQMEAWILMQKYGCIPRVILDYTNERAQSFNSKEAFNADFFDPNAVTIEMKQLGREFLRYVNIARQHIGKNYVQQNIEIIKAALKQAPLQIGVPVVPYWNNSYLKWNGDTYVRHAIELYGMNDNNEYLIFDQYEPHLKTLSSDYFVPMVTQGIVTPQPVAVADTNHILQDSYWQKFWTAVMNWFNDIYNPLPVGDQ